MEYTVIRSPRRTVGLEITKELEVLVRAPREMSDRDIRELVGRHSEWIEKHRRLAAERGKCLPDEADRERLTARAREYLPGRVAYYAALMGVAPAKITVTGAKTRFGSCSAANSLCFSWRLMAYPDALVDYVVVHELAHIRHHNHSPAFYDFIAGVMPDHRERRERLRKFTGEAGR